jgi:hydrogenase maturation protein HypF
VDWGSVLDAVIEECERGTDTGIISARFHNTMVEIIVSTARLAGEDCVLLTGGCFQNRYLSERAVSRLRDEGFRPYWNQRVPPNDGGIAVGQVVAADQQLKEVSRVPGRTR